MFLFSQKQNKTEYTYIFTKKKEKKKPKCKQTNTRKEIQNIRKFLHFSVFVCRDFINECLKSPPVRPYEISVEQKALWTFLFGTMLFIAIVGNSIVLWIVLGKFFLILA